MGYSAEHEGMSDGYEIAEALMRYEMGGAHVFISMVCILRIILSG